MSPKGERLRARGARTEAEREGWQTTACLSLFREFYLRLRSKLWEGTSFVVFVGQWQKCGTWCESFFSCDKLLTEVSEVSAAQAGDQLGP